MASQSCHGGTVGVKYCSKAIECLQKLYDRPPSYIASDAHIQGILVAPGVKDGSGMELWQLHDTWIQDLQVLKVTKCEPSGAFIISLIEMKVHQLTMFE